MMEKNTPGVKIVENLSAKNIAPYADRHNSLPLGILLCVCLIDCLSSTVLYSKFLNTFLFLISNKMLVICAEIHKILA